ncbi:MAG: sulfite exporter TauE/SafE family protein [Aquisalimonadaceae bacterium]
MVIEGLGMYLMFGGAMATAGIVAGIVAGLLGVGGGIILVPVLFYLFTLLDIDPAIRMHLAVGTSLATVVITAITSTRAHWPRGTIDTALLRSWAPWMILGAIAGMVFFGKVNSPTLTLIFATVALIVAFYMAWAKERDVALASTLPEGPARYGLGTVIGGVSAVMGIGGGTLCVPILSLFRYPIRQAVGTSAAIGLLIAVPGSIGAVIAGYGHPSLPPFSFGYVNLLGFILLVPLTAGLAPLGARIAHSINQQHLRYAFALFLLITSVNMYAMVLL